MHDFDDEGRIFAAKRASYLNDDDAIMLLCGQPHLMTLDELKQLGIDPEDLLANPTHYKATRWGWEGDIEKMVNIKTTEED